MTTRRALVLGLALLVCSFCLLFADGCCLTNRLWGSVADQPQGLVGASLSEDFVLHLAVRYEDGRTWHVTAPLMVHPEWTKARGRRVGPLAGELPSSAYQVVSRLGVDPQPGQVDVYYMSGSDKRGNTTRTVWVDSARCKSVVYLPEPIDWSRIAPYLAVLASPFTFLVDLVTAPIWVAWVIFTVGGHGDCWLPWCD